MSQRLKEQIQTVLDEATSKAGGVPGLVFAAVDKYGQLIVSVTSGNKDVQNDSKIAMDDIFWVASCTKLLTNICMLQLVERGKIGLDDDIAVHLPEYKNRPIRKDKKLTPSKNPITLRNLLTHTCGSGYSFINDELHDWSKEHQIDEMQGGWEGFAHPLVCEPSTRWEYGVGPDIASRLLTKITGLSLGDYMEEYVFKPMGIRDATFDIQKRPDILDRVLDLSLKDETGKITRKHDRNNGLVKHGYNSPSFHAGGGGLFISAGAYCQVIAAVLNDGLASNNARILNKDTIDLAWQDQLELLGIPESDLDRPLEGKNLELIAPIPGVPPSGVAKWSPDDQHSWNLLGCLCKTDIAMTGRKAPSVWWNGISNTYWWMDRVSGIGGIMFSQVLPLADLDVFLSWIKAEKAVYDFLSESP